ncbi:hypothetical protein ABW21_db0208916 [Orbilia brochopaga]|nr:hypothetical protein ABW21_db0208916 [Drechslerella brochopaga]
MDNLDRLLDALARAASDPSFHPADPPTAKASVVRLFNLVKRVCNEVKDAETAMHGQKTARELELLHAAKATEAAARAANAAADAADSATVAATLSEGRLAGRAVTAALRAAGAAYRAATSARYAATAAETLPSGAYLRYDGEVTRSLIEEKEQLRNIQRFLFQEQVVQSSTGMYSQLSVVGQTSGTAADLGLARDAELRARNIEKLVRSLERHLDDDFSSHMPSQPAIFAGKPAEDDESQIEILSGKIKQEQADDFLTFPGKMNNLAIKPLIDTGGGCNIVKAEWLQRNSIVYDTNSRRVQTLLMADGSKSKECPCIDVRWSFDGRAKCWTDVEFVVVEGYEYEALIGLPFLKHTETIHNSQGNLVFPEFHKIHARKDAVPFYGFNTSKQGKGKA